MILIGTRIVGNSFPTRQEYGVMHADIGKH